MSDSYERALRLLAARSHSRMELRRKLLRRSDTSSRQVEDILERLESQGYLDDEAFAYQCALGRRRKRWGLTRIARDLRSRGIEAGIIERIVERVGRETQESNVLQEVIQRWIEKSGTPQTASQLKKLYDRCIRLGYSPEPVRRQLAPFFETIDWNEK